VEVDGSMFALVFDTQSDIVAFRTLTDSEQRKPETLTFIAKTTNPYDPPKECQVIFKAPGKVEKFTYGPKETLSPVQKRDILNEVQEVLLKDLPKAGGKNRKKNAVAEERRLRNAKIRRDLREIAVQKEREAAEGVGKSG
jgi:hypothetical protein